MTDEIALKWAEVCRDVKVGGAIHMTFRVDSWFRCTAQKGWVTMWEIVADIYVTCVHTGSPIGLMVRTPLQAHITERADMIEHLRRIAHQFYLHECDEQIRVGDTRPFTPHDDHAEAP